MRDSLPRQFVILTSTSAGHKRAKPSPTYPSPLPELPPHRIVTQDEYKELRNVYPIMRYQWCDWSYPDWFVCLPSRGKVSCDRLPYRNVTVTREDPLGLDPDENGLGCEKEADKS